MKKIQLSGAVLGAATALLLTGCGGGGASTNGVEKKPADQAAQLAADSLKTAKSVHVIGTGTSSGEPVSFDLRVTQTASQGSVTEGTSTFQIIQVGKDTYVKGNEKFYASSVGPEAAKLIGNRWMKVPASDSSQFSDFTLKGLADSASPGDAAGGTVATTKLDGKKAVLVTQKDGTKIWLSQTGIAYPLKVTSTGTDNGTITYTDFDKAVTITPPADAIDISKLTG